MTKLKIKRGDTVKVIAGDARGQQGKVTEVQVAAQKAVVEGVNIVSRHSKPSASNPQGGIVKKEAPIHISNLVKIEGTAKPAAKKASKKTKKAEEAK